MWGLMKEWLDGNTSSIPDNDDLEVDLCGLRYSYDSRGRLKLESKDDAKKRGVKSPDDGDALALTWAFPVRSKARDIIHSKIKPRQPAVAGMGM